MSFPFLTIHFCLVWKKLKISHECLPLLIWNSFWKIIHKKWLHIYLQFQWCLHGVNRLTFPLSLLVSKPFPPGLVKPGHKKTGNHEVNVRVSWIILAKMLRDSWRIPNAFRKKYPWCNEKAYEKRRRGPMGISTCEQFLGATFGWFKQVWWQSLLFVNTFSLSWSLFWHQDSTFRRASLSSSETSSNTFTNLICTDFGVVSYNSLGFIHGKSITPDDWWESTKSRSQNQPHNQHSKIASCYLPDSES